MEPLNVRRGVVIRRSRELRQKGKESLREMSLALSSGLEAGNHGGNKAHRGLPRVSSDSSLHNNGGSPVRKAPSFDNFPALEQLRAVAESAVEATPFGRRKSNVGSSENTNGSNGNANGNVGMGMGMGMRRWGASGAHHRSQSTSDLELAGHTTPERNHSGGGANGAAAAAGDEAELAELDAAPPRGGARRSLAEAATEQRRSLGLSPEAARPSSSRNHHTRKHSGRRSESDAAAFSLSAKAGEPGPPSPPSRASDGGQLSSAPASPEQVRVYSRHYTCVFAFAACC